MRGVPPPGDRAAARRIARFHGLEYVDLRQIELDRALNAELPIEALRTHRVVALAKNRGAWVFASGEPGNGEIVRRLQGLLAAEVRCVFADVGDIAWALRTLLDPRYGLLAGDDDV
ncbi:MAG: hypothetical protein PF961_17715 [Planctomycetota bacterium]|nr:hypothetical protein [Planctomycetota bacterium]